MVCIVVRDLPSHQCGPRIDNWVEFVVQVPALFQGIFYGFCAGPQMSPKLQMVPSYTANNPETGSDSTTKSLWIVSTYFLYTLAR